VLAILGPLVLGLSVFDGFQPSLRNWLARYISVYLWLPVANIFGAIIANIQAAMLQQDIQQIQNYGGTYFSSTDIGYLIFLIIGIVGYFTVPSVAGYIVSTWNSDALAGRVNQLATTVRKGIVTGVKVMAGGV
jgi:conjugative transposon TraJ protein